MPTGVPALAVKAMSTNKQVLQHFSLTDQYACSSLADFTGATSTTVFSDTITHCQVVTFTGTNYQVRMCGYILSTGTGIDLWQVKQKSSQFAGGLGIDSVECSSRDICSSSMIQLEFLSINSLNSPKFAMMTTSTAPIAYSVYGSNITGARGPDLLYSGTSVDAFGLIFGTAKVGDYKFLSIVASGDPSGALLQKLRLYVPCSPTAAPSSPSVSPSALPSFIPTCLPSPMPTHIPTFSPSFSPTTTEFYSYESSSIETFSSRPVLMHQFQFLNSYPKYMSASCQQYVIDNVQNSTASLCNYVEINNGHAVFTPTAYDKVPYIQIRNIVELSNVNAFSIAAWLTIGVSYDSTYPLFSFGDISFPTSVKNTSSVFPYERLGCYTKQIVKKKLLVIASITTLSSCVSYANANGFIYFSFGKNLCRSVVFYLHLLFCLLPYSLYFIQ